MKSHTRAVIRREALGAIVVVLAITSTALPVLGPIREAAARLRCAANLQHIGLGAQGYAEANETRLPHNQVVAPHGSWNAQLLPYIGHETLAKQYSLAADWWDADNTTNRNAAKERVPTFLCPATPHPERQVVTMDPSIAGQNFAVGATDYVGSAGAYLNTNAQENLHPGAMHHRGLLRRLRIGDIVDGTSNTLLVVEMADKPYQWRAGKMVEGRGQAPQMARFGGGQWAAPNWNHLRSHTPDGQTAFGTCAVNCSNGAGIYGFHPNGANVVFVDGSVKFLRAGMSQEMLIALVTYAGGEVLAPDDY